jgi:hypothetical protein
MTGPISELKGISTSARGGNTEDATISSDETSVNKSGRISAFIYHYHQHYVKGSICLDDGFFR